MKPLIVANWKMNPQTLAEAKKLFNLVKRGIKNIKDAEVIICPPFVYLPVLLGCDKSSLAIDMGGQNCFWEESGSFTGEISSLMLKNLGADYVIIGHSERRIYFGETDEMINKKVKAAIKAKMFPILCVGETQKQKNREETGMVLRKQIETGLKGISKFKIQNSKFSIAYEPIWAIGTGKSCSINETMSSVLFIRKVISRLYSRALAKNLRILYGGSVTKENASDYIKEARTDGLLVGGASLKAKEFVKIIKSV